uniref:JmjC domain-containing protein n=1 Tax=Anopheles maculatus TaxID=74869 RepID=A0A182SN45_9DIPT
MNADVPVYRTDQHAGEFVVTFPRAYHAGFNQGYNFAEAVNFAPADWMKMGRECVNHYSKLRRYCVFSHDELVCKMALEPDRLNLGIATACYIDMAEMVDTEKKLRKNLLEWGVSNAEREAFELLTDDARQCEICKTTCFLSAVNCKCTKNLACLRHFAELCECPPENHTLKYRYTLDELPLMVQKLKVKAESFEKWLFRVRDVLDPSVASSITLEELQSIAHEAESQKFPNSVILERLNLSILEAQKCITVIQQLDINKIRTRTRNSLECAKYKLSMDELELFINEINNLRCVIREGDSVRELQRIGQEWLRQADKALKLRFKDTNVQQLNQLIEDGNGLCIELPQITELKDRLTQYKWYREVRTLRENTVDRLSLEEIKKLINEGMRILPHTVLEKELSQLHGIMLQIVDWEQSANQCFKTETQHKISEIDSLLERAQNIEAFLPLAGQLKDVLHKSKEWLHAIETLESSKNYNFFHTLQNLANRAKLLPVEMESKLLCETIFGTTTAGGGCYNRNGGQMLLFNSRGFIGASGDEWRSKSSASPSTSLKRKRNGSITNLDEPVIPGRGLETIMKKIKEDGSIGEQDKRLLRAKLLLDWNESDGGLAATGGDKHMFGSYDSVQQQQQHRLNNGGCDVVYHCAKCYEMVAKANVLRKYRHKQHHHHCRHHERHSRAMAVKQEQNQQQTSATSNLSAMEQLLQMKILSEDDFAVVKGASSDAAGSSFDDFSFKFGEHYDGEDEPDDEEAADEVKAEDEDDDDDDEDEEAGDGVGQLGRNGCHGCKPPDEHERDSGILKPLLACTGGGGRIKAEPLDNADSSRSSNTDDKAKEEAQKTRHSSKDATTLCLESTSQASESPTANGGARNSSGTNGISTSTNASQQQQHDRQRQEQHQQTKAENL